MCRSAEIKLALSSSLTMRNDISVLSSTQMSPAQLLRQIFSQHDTKRRAAPSRTTQRRLRQQEPELLGNYTMETVRAIRDNDIEALRGFLEANGQGCFDAANRNGESLLHLACRRGNMATIYFLLNEANVSLYQSRDEDDDDSLHVMTDSLGRSPLHDVCWRPEASPEVLSLFLAKLTPYALLQADQRGHTPLDYVRREHWPIWIQFLQEYEPHLRRRIEIASKFQ
jgi:Ankyrin repeat